MVGAIKSLTDLRRIEAAVRVTCKKCGHVRMIDREVLIKHCSFHRSSLDWEDVRAGLWCWRSGCLSRNTHVEALPFSQDEVALRHKRAETILMNLALRVLKDAAYRPNSEAMATTDVRLALRVLYPYMGSRDTLTRYWDIAVSSRFHAWQNCHNEFAVIAATLVDRGYAVDADFR
ncbi:hypothetical protein EJC47_11095 [Sphingomonas sp. TF3]|uniref:hypothetical protein n=1 Tax=Sphingomonas sp. TF3 TaxID=2495580 RepID=UPI000F88A29B|nr:hypothetical protein [Sphingomonas sp. TF3]RUN76509.1 hypothetical protein EJC47_11095 [Sphingomonas sp. TF3]